MKPITTVLVFVVTLAAFATAAEAQTITITNPTPAWTRGQVIVSALVTTVNGIPAVATHQVTGGNTPPGITLGGVGTLTGTPTLKGSAMFTVKATVLLVGSATQTLTMTINDPPSFTPTSLAAGQVNKAYTGAVSFTGGTAPYGYVVWSGTFPPGLILSPTTGAITGTPTAKGDYGFVVRGTDMALAFVDQPLMIAVREKPSLAATGATTWTVNRSGFNLRIAASGGDGSYTFDPPTGVPAGITVTTDATGVSLTGTPTDQETTNVSVQVTDGTGATATLDTPVTINPPPRIATDSLPDATVGATYGATVTASDGAQGYTFRIVTTTAGWLGIDGPTGTFTGTPASTGGVEVRVEVTDASGATAAKYLTFEVVAAPVLSASPLPIGIAGQSYSAGLNVVGGAAPLTATLASGQLPAGLSFSGATITGTPAISVHESFTVRLVDRWGATTEAPLQLTIGRRFPVNGKLTETTIDNGDRQALVFDLLRGTEFSVSLKVKSGMEHFTVALLSIAGVEVDTTPWRKNGKKSVKLSKVPIVTSGRYALLVANTGNLAGVRFSGKTKGKPEKKIKEQKTFGPLTGVVAIPFTALKGSRLTIQAKVAGKDAPAAEFLEILDPLGRPIDAGPYLKAIKGGFKISKLMTGSAGGYVLRFRPAPTGTADGILKVTVKIKAPKEYTYTIN